MDFRRLRYFETVARSGSFTAAAEILNISQPALSYHIKLLEGELGVYLLNRHAKGVSLTPAGDTLIRDVQTVFEDLARANRNLTRFRRRKRATLRLGMAPTAGRVLGPEILAAAVADRNHVISLNEGLTVELLKDIQLDRIDAAICHEVPRTFGQQRYALYEEDLFLVGSADMVSSADGDIEFDELANFQLVIDHGMHLIRQLLDSTSAKRRVSLNFALEVDANHIKRELIAHHKQCSVVPFGYVSDLVRFEGLQVRRIVNPLITCTTILLPRPNLSRPSVNFLHSCVIPAVRRKIETGELGWRPSYPEMRVPIPDARS